MEAETQIIKETGKHATDRQTTAKGCGRKPDLPPPILVAQKQTASHANTNQR